MKENIRFARECGADFLQGQGNPPLGGKAWGRGRRIATGAAGTGNDRGFTWGDGKESPSHSFAVPGPFRQGAKGTGVRIATASVSTGFAMTWFFARGAVRRADVGSESNAAGGG